MVYKEISNNVKTDNARVKKDNINMKKVIIAIFLLTLCLSFSACTDEEQLVERSIDGIAAYLGYTDGEEIVDVSGEVPGAKAGKDFDQGNISIYEFDPLSYEYKDHVNQLGRCNGGFVLMIGGNELTDREMDDLTQRFEEMKFE